MVSNKHLDGPLDWKTVEMLGRTYYAHRGWRVLIDIVDQSIFDFVILRYKNHQLEVRTVNVKKSLRRRRRNSWAFGLSGAHKNKNKKKKKRLVYADIYLCWIPEKRNFVEIDGDVAKKSRSRCVTIPFNKILEL